MTQTPANVYATTILKPRSGLAKLNLAELWRYREVVLLMSWRDINVRYKHTFLGIAWVVVQPIVMALTFTVLLGNFGKLPSEGKPYPLLTFAGLLPWQFFARTVVEGSSSLVNNRGIITKIYFPRVVIPIACALPPAIDLAVSFVALLVIMPFFGVTLSWNILALPFLVVWLAVVALGPALLGSALSAYYRDFRHLVPFTIQFLLFISPVAYTDKIVPTQWKTLYTLNPMVGIIDAFRWCLLAQGDFPATEILTSLPLVMLFLCGGFQYFRQVESGMADVV